MTDPKLVLPLLDGFLIGEAISEHNGVRCYPAMEEKTGDKYILKSVSVPADGANLDALLLAGAFPDRTAAVDYYKGLAEGVAKEASLLQNFSQLEGFTGYDAWQIETSEDGESFIVYLLGKYRPTLERFLSRNPMTHLGAVNLGLDLCSALAVSRRSGYLFVDLKPGNVFICADNEYRIGDVGFVAMDSLQFASLPDKYRSSYTAPEVTDAYSALNDTLDTYAVGLILYQIYNNGQLPQVQAGSKEPLAAPEYADSEMASIILKACDPDPAERWQDPAQMGQALVNYMQSNTVNDEPVVPPVLPVEEAEEVVADAPAEEDPSTEEILTEVDQALESVGVEIVEETIAEEVIEEVAEEAIEEAVEEIEEEAAETEDAVEAEAVVEEVVEESAEEAEDDSLAEMLAQADSLIAHETPEPVVAPAPIDVPIPPRIVLTDEAEDEETQEEIAEEDMPAEEILEEVSELTEEEPEEIPEEEPEVDAYSDEYSDEPEEPVKRGKGLIIALISFIVAASLFIGGYLFYKYEYQQTIHSLSITSVDNILTVTIYSDIEDELLTVVCIDDYGNAYRQNVQGGMAVFTNLPADTRYRVEVEISGFHQLLGQTSGVYTSAAETTISDIKAAVDTENGSVKIDFTVRGPDSNQWRIYYSAEGEAEKFVVCSNHTAIINGLTVGKEYTFRIEPTTDLYLVGNNTVKFTAVNVVTPENLTILGFTQEGLVITWDAPEGADTTHWVVRCFNDAGFYKTITVTETTVVLTELDRTASYTIEVCAEGMSQGESVTLMPNSINILEITADTSNPLKLTLSWTFDGETPVGGWVVKYTISGMVAPVLVNTEETSILIDPIIPGCEYSFEILTANGDPVFNGTFSHTAPEAEVFSGYGISAEFFQFSMCRTPNKTNWTRYDVKSSDYTTSFAVGQSASFVVRLRHEYNTSPNNITTLFVIRKGDGTLVGADTRDATWTSMWYGGYGTMTIPTMPDEAGDYTVEIYFNGKYVTIQNFAVTQNS